MKEELIARAKDLLKWGADGQLIHKSEWMKVVTELLKLVEGK